LRGAAALKQRVSKAAMSWLQQSFKGELVHQIMVHFKRQKEYINIYISSGFRSFAVFKPLVSGWFQNADVMA
jgi:hypothetical protein